MQRSPTFNVSNLQQYNQLMQATQQPCVKKAPVRPNAEISSQPQTAVVTTAAPLPSSSLNRSNTNANLAAASRVIKTPTRTLTSSAARPQQQQQQQRGITFNNCAATTANAGYSNNAAVEPSLNNRTPAATPFSTSFVNQTAATPDFSRYSASNNQQTANVGSNPKVSPSTVSLTYRGELEQHAQNSQHPTTPLPTPPSSDLIEEIISVNGERGVYVNKAEVNSWRGSLPIEKYEINRDPNPEIVTKRPFQAVDVKNNNLLTIPKKSDLLAPCLKF
jgi:hypothetical protein